MCDKYKNLMSWPATEYCIMQRFLVIDSFMPNGLSHSLSNGRVYFLLKVYLVTGTFHFSYVL